MPSTIRLVASVGVTTVALAILTGCHAAPPWPDPVDGSLASHCDLVWNNAHTHQFKVC